MREFTVVVLACLVLLPVPDPASAQSPGMLNSLRQARALEKKGDYSSAGMDYLSVLKNNCNGDQTTGSSDASLPTDFKAALGRRAVACLTIEARKKMGQAETPADSMRSWILGYLDQAYEIMSKLEPDNPTWPYLTAAHEIAQGRFSEASEHLQACARSTGGQASVREKASSLLTLVSKYAGNSRARLDFADKEALQTMLSGEKASAPEAAETPASDAVVQSKPAVRN